VTGTSMIDRLLIQHILCFKTDSVWMAKKNMKSNLFVKETEQLFRFKDIKAFSKKRKTGRYEVMFELKDSKTYVLSLQFGLILPKRKLRDIEAVFERIENFLKGN
jgi:hypothetical protein